MRRRLPALCAAILLLTACTTTGVRPSADWDVRRAALLNVAGWQLRGRLGYLSSDGEGGQASLRWQQTTAESRLRLAGPFGAGAYELLLAPEFVSVSDAGGTRSIEYTGPAATENFLREQLGWSFPAGAARYWMLGILDPEAPGTERFAPDGTLESLTQHGWQVDYERFGEFDGALLPVKLVMENTYARLRVIISDWTLEGSATAADSL